MKSRKRCFSRRVATFGLAFLFLTFPFLIRGQESFDSEAPTLLSESSSLRALALSPETFLRAETPKAQTRAFDENSTVVLFASNLKLMPGEGANALRVNVEDAKGRHFRFPVESIKPLRKQKGVYALTVRLKDELGFWENPNFDGDVLLSLVWRGMASNRARFGIGKLGGSFKSRTEESLKSEAALAKTSDDPRNAESRVRQSSAFDRTRFMEQATFGPWASLNRRVLFSSFDAWLNTQFDLPYPTNPYPNLPLMPGVAPADCDATCRRDLYSMYPVQNWFFKEALYGEAQLRHRIAWALSQLWVISGTDTQQASHMFAYHQVLSRNAFANYRNLMYEMTLNPGMGNYLDMARSTKNSPNENYAREVLQLFNIGLFMLNQDGTLQLDENGNPIPTYDQTTVNNFTKVFTGWSFCNTGCPNSTTGAPNYKDPLVLNQNNHNTTAKTLLSYPNAVNQNIPANQNGLVDLNQALDNIFYHPNVAPHVSRFLIQQLVTSDPAPAYVGRVAAVFNDNGSGTRGDLKAVVRAILLDPEARGRGKTDPNYGKLREPVLLATNIMRQFNARSADGTTQSDGYINQIIAPMGQSAFFPPTVFNYYQPNYTIPGTALNGPEFAILNTGTAIARANFANTIIYSRVNVGTNAPYGTSLDFTAEQITASDADQLVYSLNAKLMHGAMSPQMHSTIVAAVNAIPATDTLGRVRAAVYLVVTSSQYQVQR